MSESKYFVVKQKAVPEVLSKVVEAKTSAGVRTCLHGAGGHRPGGNQQEFFL